MTDGLVLQPGAGRTISGASMTLKVGAGQSAAWSAAIAEVRARHDIQQLTAMVVGQPR